MNYETTTLPTKNHDSAQETISAPVKILLAENHGIIREGLRVLLDREEPVKVTGLVSNGREVIDFLENNDTDLVLMDMNMPVMNGLECTLIIKKLYPEIKVLILSTYDEESYLMDVLDAGADGYILKNCTKEELLFAIHKVSNDSMYIGPEFTLRLITKERLKKNHPVQPEAVQNILSDREMDVLKLLAEGLTNAEMAAKLFISVRTIETRRKKILEKTGTTNTATLMRYAIKNGLVR